MKSVQTRIDIDATGEEVWAALMDFEAYPSWNPMVVAISGQPETGASLAITIAVQGGRKMSFTPVVVECEPARRFAWLGRLWMRGLFDGLHRFDIETRPGGVTFHHGEEFRGLLVGFLPKLLRDTQTSMEAMNEALVREVAARSLRQAARLQPA